MRRVLFFAALVVISTSTSPAFGQAATQTSGLVGAWECTQGSAGLLEVGTRTEFKDGGSSWELTMTSGPWRGTVARGSAKVQDGSVELTGKYVSGRLSGELSYSLIHRGEILDGTGIGALRAPFPVTCHKAK